MEEPKKVTIELVLGYAALIVVIAAGVSLGITFANKVL